MKKVILFVVDALSARVLLPAMERGDLPTFSQLAERGHLLPECISIFPSITPAALTSIVTGHYPSRHNVGGAYWYNEDQNQVAYYGDDVWVILKRGIGDFFQDFLLRLNRDRLKSETLFERVENENLEAACLNFFIYRGNHQHAINPPLLLKLIELFPGVDFSEYAYGPTQLHLGDFVTTRIDYHVPLVGHLWNRLGFDDQITTEVFLETLEKHYLPDFTLAYYPDNDFRSHEVGPENAVDTLKQVDAYLKDILAALGGIDNALEEYCILLLGDHSQCNIVDENNKIDLEALLGDFNLAEGGTAFDAEDELMICPNMRTAQIYFNQPKPSYMQPVIEQLLTDDRVDQVIWSAKINGVTLYYVRTPKGESLIFWESQAGRDAPQPPAKDVYGREWQWEGDLSAVDGQVSDDGILTFPHYPNAFERIKNALDMQHSGHLWITAREGYDIGTSTTPTHTGGGSHGSLHVGDSTTALLIAGLPEGINVPRHPRIVDVAPICLQVLGIDTENQIDRSH